MRRQWTILDDEPVPDDDGTMYLMARGREFVIQVNGRELMGSREHGSETALADLACDRLDDSSPPRILVGGLGMGFTLAAALARVGPEGLVTVAELLPAVIRWNRDYLGGVAGYPLDDPRTVVFEGDVADALDVGTPWSAVLLDVDNGPRSLTRPTNGWLYTPQGLRTARRCLVAGGVLGIWSATNDARLTRLLRKEGFAVEVVRHTELGRPSPDASGTHWLWMARNG